jgi:hypothetical protein
MTHEVEVIDENTVRLTESVSTVTEYDIPTLQEQRARLVEWSAKYTAERNAEIAEIDRILNLITEATP